MDVWKPGQPLTARDRELLAPLMAKAEELGRTPLVAEVASAALIKSRFRVWKSAVLAAGLPALNDPEQVRIREAEHRAKEAEATDSIK